MADTFTVIRNSRSSSLTGIAMMPDRSRLGVMSPAWIRENKLNS